MKKVMLWMLVLIMCVGCLNALGETIPRAAGRPDMKMLKRYPSYAEDADGIWTVRSNAADALLERFANTGADSSQSFCVFLLSLEGSSRTDVWTPVLEVYYAYSSKPLNATAISLLADGVRYDFAAQSEQVKVGKKNAERIFAPLTQAGVEALQEVMEADEVSIRLMGETRYTASLEKDSSTGRKQTEAASLQALSASMALFEEAGLSDYTLWDLSEAAWKERHGFAPLFQAEELNGKIASYDVADEFGMILPQDRSDAAQYMQQALLDGGFFSGSIGRTFTESASTAVRRAQKYLGLIETGCADQVLLSALEEGMKKEKEETFAFVHFADTAEIALSRYWFAKGVSAKNGTDKVRLAANSDHLFLAADGWVRNLSMDELRLFIQMEAQVIYQGKYAYDATLLCERDGGSDLDMALLPLAEARLLVYAEIPAWLSQDTEAEWMLKLTIKDQSVEFELQ